ncbi:MAG: DUF4351 domain-containing protein, partial [Calothrix sp. C42_A2020_038]|nr:DUF4351 domain-containing protein [Calothrix sp. C42_A2020_038]
QQTRVYQEILAEGIQEGEQRGEQRGREQGREQGEKSLVLRQLTRRVGELPQSARQQVESLSLEQLENLGEALLDFRSMADLDEWLAALNP